MSAITVSEFQVPDCQFLGSTAKLRLYSDGDWTDSLGVPHLQGTLRSVNSFYQEIACALSGDVLSVPAFTTYSTLDALQNPNVRISGEIFDESGAWRKTLFENWFIPISPTTTTRNALEIANQGTALNWPPSTYLNAAGVQALIDAVIGLLRFATTVIAGWVRLSWPAANTADPIAVSDTDPRLGSYQNILAYGASTAKTAAQNATAITAAVAAAAVVGGGIYIPVGTFPTSSVSITVPILFAPGASILSVSTGQTVTSTKTVSADVSQHFGNALSGQGTIVLSAIGMVYPEWWGADPTGVSDAKPAIQAAVTSLTRGGIVQLGLGVYKLLTGVTIIVDGVQVVGMGAGTAGALSHKPTSIDASSLASNSYAFTVVGQTAGNTLKDAKFRDFYVEMLSGSGQVGGAAIKVYNASGVDIKVDTFVPRGATSYGIQFGDVAGGLTSWVTATGYVVGNSVKNRSNIAYVCIANHTSSALSEPGNPDSLPNSTWTQFWVATGVIHSFIHGTHVSDGTPVLVGQSCTAVYADTYTLGQSTGGIYFYQAKYSGAVFAASDSSDLTLATGWGYVVDGSNGITLESCGAENLHKGFLKITGGSVGVSVIAPFGTGNNRSADPNIGSLIDITSTGTNYNITIDNPQETNPDAATTYSIYGHTGTLFTQIRNNQATSLPKGVGGDLAWLTLHLSQDNGGSIKAGDMAIGTAGANGSTYFDVSVSDSTLVGPIARFQNRHASAYSIVDIDRASNVRTAAMEFSTSGVADWYAGELFAASVANSKFSISPDNTLANAILSADLNTVTVKSLTPTGGVLAAGGFSSSPRNLATGGVPAISATQGTDATPVNTETYIVEVFIPANVTLTGVAILNGSAVAGNVKISLANSSGVPIAAAVTASTAQAGTAVYQKIPFAVPYAAVGPATYYLLVQFSTNATPRYRAHAVGIFGASKKTGEVFGTFTTVTPPTTFSADLGPVASFY